MESESKQKPIKSFYDLRVYQQSYQASLGLHQVTLNFPSFERGETGSQLRRASKSIPINIAKGYGRKKSPEDFKRFLVIALGSCDEVRVLLDFCRDLKYITPEKHKEFSDRYIEIGKGINKLIQVWR